MQLRSASFINGVDALANMVHFHLHQSAGGVLTNTGITILKKKYCHARTGLFRRAIVPLRGTMEPCSVCEGERWVEVGEGPPPPPQWVNSDGSRYLKWTVDKTIYL